MLSILRIAALATTLVFSATPALANVITDWDTKAVAFVTPRMPAPVAARAVAMIDLAMFDAVNSIEPRYRPYLGAQTATAGTSQEAAAASAAANVMIALDPSAAADVKASLAAYLASLPDGAAKTNGIALGEAMAAKCVEARAKDGASAPDDYRPKTKPGVYIPTPPTLTPMWAKLTPFALSSPAQFRPKPPISLTSPQWTADYNEIKDYGGRTSAKRSAQQTEDARFWLMTGPQSTQPVVRQIVAAKNMSVVESARLVALAALAAADALIAVMDAKYYYEFWRPVTAIRNGDTYGNSATVRDATWLPIDNTPMHPEYPCAHCIASAAVASAIETVLGSADVPEFSMTSSTAPGVTHRWTNLWAYSNEISQARIWAGFHYRFSTVVGQEMGRNIGRYAAQNVLQPVAKKPS
jgi:hypothetical protein